ncbi:MAG TPA: MlaD family protein [Longimicrobiales bacterium]|nr:MlaD family protein [Longimicrobiales bacterium]
MSIRANPTAIGLFLIGALVLTVGGTAVLASTTWLQKRSTFVSYFQESVNGLENGAPVKFQGVPIGTVTGLLIQIDERDKTFQVPVEYEIDLTRLTTQLGTFVDLSDPAVLRQQIMDGLRAQLQTESIVTGQLYIELSYRSDPDPPSLERQATAWPEIPTTPSLMAALGTGAGSLVEDMMRVLFQVNELLAEVNMPEINAAVVASAEAVERLVDSPEIRTALQQIPGMTLQVNQTMAEFERLASRAGAAIDPLQAQMEGTTAELTATLAAMRRTLEETHGLLSADTNPGYGLQEALASLRDAADALRLLAESIDQNPDMLLRGRKPPED